MSRKQRIEITVETDQILAIRRHRAPAWRRQCAGQVEMLTEEEAVSAASVSLSTIHRRAEEGQLHLSETAEGRLFICLNSLLNSTTKGETL